MDLELELWLVGAAAEVESQLVDQGDTLFRHEDLLLDVANSA